MNQSALIQANRMIDDQDETAPAADLTRHVTDKETWLRFAYMLFFAAIFYVVTLLSLAVALGQFLAQLFSGEPFTRLIDFGGNLAAYQAQLGRYLMFNADILPYPFAPFPNSAVLTPVEDTPEI